MSPEIRTKEIPRSVNTENPESHSQLILILKRRDNGELEIGKEIDNRVYSTVTPAVMMMANQEEKIGQRVLVTSQLLMEVPGNCLQVICELKSTHVIKKGLNIFCPESAINTIQVPIGRYVFQAIIDRCKQPEASVSIGENGVILDYENLEVLEGKITLDGLNKLTQG